MTARLLDITHKKTYPRFGDLVLDLYNQRLGRFDVANLLQNLDDEAEWGYIIPRIMARNIPVKYQIQELEFPTENRDPDTAKAIEIYRTHDSVMVKSHV